MIDWMMFWLAKVVVEVGVWVLIVLGVGVAYYLIGVRPEKREQRALREEMKRSGKFCRYCNDGVRRYRTASVVGFTWRCERDPDYCHKYTTNE